MYRILEGDVIEQLKTLADASVDSIVTDPPYHLTAGKKGGTGEASVNLDTPAGRARVTTGFMGMTWDGGDIAQNVEMWKDALRVLKPGGHLLAFGGSRTYHRMACAIEDAGFEIRDQIMWIYGSGFPKSLDVSKAIDKMAGAKRKISGHYEQHGIFGGVAYAHDKWTIAQANQNLQIAITDPATDAAKQWAGWGTALKPAHEPIVVARKPLVGTVAENVLKYGTGALNIDACRIGDFVNTTPPGTDRYNAANFEHGYRPSAYGREGEASKDRRYAQNGATNFAATPGPRGGSPAGRWPANVIHDGSDEVVDLFPADAGAAAPVTVRNGDKFRNTFGKFAGDIDEQGSTFHGDTGSAARFFYCAKTSREERNRGCEDLGKKPLLWSSGTQSPGTFQAEGTDRTSANNHPTVKPVALMSYLCQLVTQSRGTVLDLFMGSGSTGIAAIRNGFDFIGIELNPAYVEIAKRRIEADAPLFNKTGGKTGNREQGTAKNKPTCLRTTPATKTYCRGPRRKGEMGDEPIHGVWERYEIPGMDAPETNEEACLQIAFCVVEEAPKIKHLLVLIDREDGSSRSIDNGLTVDEAKAMMMSLHSWLDQCLGREQERAKR